MNDKNNNCLMCKYFHRDETENPCYECKLNSGFVNRDICNVCEYKDSNFTQDYPCDICDDRNSSFSYSDRCDLEIKGVREMDLQEKLGYIAIVGEMILNYAKDYPDVASFMLKNKVIKTDAKTGLSVEITLRRENK